MAAFDWDDGNWPKCGEHGLTKDDIEFVLNSNPIILPDPYPQETRDQAIGITRNGRRAFIVFTWRDGRMRPISARFIGSKDKRHG